MKTRTFGIVIVIAVVAVAAVLVVMSRDSSGAASASGYEGQMIEPADFRVADYAGKPLVVNFFGSWCEYCRVEASDLARFAEQNPGQVVGIASRDSVKNATAFMAEYGMEYPLVVDDGSLTAEYGIIGWPTTIFFDADGEETDRLVGASTFDQFNASLAEAQ